MAGLPARHGCRATPARDPFAGLKQERAQKQKQKQAQKLATLVWTPSLHVGSFLPAHGCAVGVAVDVAVSVAVAVAYMVT